MTRRARIVLASAVVLVTVLVVAGFGAGSWLGNLAETRLRGATGQPWRLSARYGLTFDGGVAATLRDVDARLDVEGGAVRVQAGTVTLGGSPLALLRGATPDRAAIDGLVVRIPSRWWERLPSGGSRAVRQARATGPFPDMITIRDGAAILVGPDGRDEASIGGVAVTVSADGAGRRIETALRFGTVPVRSEVTVGGAPGPGGAWPVGLFVESTALPGERLTAKGGATFDGTEVALSRLAGRFGPNDFTGAAGLDLAGRPRARLDLFFPTFATTASATPDQGPRDGAADLAALRFVDGRLALRIGELRAGSATVTDVTASADLAAGTITADLRGAGAYGGQVTGAVRLVPEGALLAGTLRSDLRALRLRPMLETGQDSSAVDGGLTASWDLTGRGTDRTSFLGSAAGTARVAVDDVRMNLSVLPGFMRTLVAQAVGLKADASGTSRVFESVSARFAVADGRATTSDVQALGPIVTATGSGFLDLPSGTIEFRFDPRLVGGNRLLKGLDIRLPILVDGALTAPRITPDLAGASTAGTLPDLGALGGLAGELLNGALGSSLFGGGDPAAPSRRDPPPPPPRRR